MSLRRERPGHSAAEDMMCSFCGQPWPWVGDCNRQDVLHQEIVKRRNQREIEASRFRREVLERAHREAEKRRRERE